MRVQMAGLAVLAAAALCGQSQSEHKLTARELFYTPVVETKPAPARAPAKAKVPTRTSSARPAAEPAKSPIPDPGERNRQRRTDPLYQTVAHSSAPPLAIRYSILKMRDDGEYSEVAPDTVFRSGDKIRVTVQANDDGYLYIVQQGSSRTWSLLFPDPDMDNGDNRVRANKIYTLPSAARFSFDENPGTERLFVIFSRQPEKDMEQLIYSLDRNAKPAPASAEPDRAAPKTMLAQVSPIEDAVISRLRGQLTARDLVFEKVDESSAGPNARQEKAVYVATQDRTSEARVVADLELVHR